MSAEADSLVLCAPCQIRDGDHAEAMDDLRLLAPPIRYSPFRASVGWMHSARRAGRAVARRPTPTINVAAAMGRTMSRPSDPLLSVAWATSPASEVPTMIPHAI